MNFSYEVLGMTRRLFSSTSVYAAHYFITVTTLAVVEFEERTLKYTDQNDKFSTEKSFHSCHRS